MYTKDFGDFGASLAFSRPKATSPFSTLLRNQSILTGGKVIRTSEPAEPVQVMPSVEPQAPAPALTIMPIAAPANPTGLKSIVSAAASGAVVPPINVGTRSDPIYVPPGASALEIAKAKLQARPASSTVALWRPATQATADNWEKVKQGISPTITATPATATATPAAPASAPATAKAGGGLVGPAAGAAAGFLVGGPIGAAVGAAAMFMLSKK